MNELAHLFIAAQEHADEYLDEQYGMTKLGLSKLDKVINALYAANPGLKTEAARGNLPGFLAANIPAPLRKNIREAVNQLGGPNISAGTFDPAVVARLGRLMEAKGPRLGTWGVANQAAKTISAVEDLPARTADQRKILKEVLSTLGPNPGLLGLGGAKVTSPGMSAADAAATIRRAFSGRHLPVPGEIVIPTTGGMTVPVSMKTPATNILFRGNPPGKRTLSVAPFGTSNIAFTTRHPNIAGSYALEGEMSSPTRMMYAYKRPHNFIETAWTERENPYLTAYNLLPKSDLRVRLGETLGLKHKGGSGLANIADSATRAPVRHEGGGPNFETIVYNNDLGKPLGSFFVTPRRSATGTPLLGLKPVSGNVDLSQFAVKTGGVAGAGIGGVSGALLAALRDIKNPELLTAKDHLGNAVIHGLNSVYAGHGIEQAIRGKHRWASRVGGLLGTAPAINNVYQDILYRSMLQDVGKANKLWHAKLMSEMPEGFRNPIVAGGFDIAKGFGSGAATADLLAGAASSVGKGVSNTVGKLRGAVSKLKGAAA